MNAAALCTVVALNQAAVLASTAQARFPKNELPTVWTGTLTTDSGATATLVARHVRRGRGPLRCRGPACPTRQGLFYFETLYYGQLLAGLNFRKPHDCRYRVACVMELETDVYPPCAISGRSVCYGCEYDSTTGLLRMVESGTVSMNDITTAACVNR